jgi:hypothetical protein
MRLAIGPFADVFIAVGKSKSALSVAAVSFQTLGIEVRMAACQHNSRQDKAKK